MKKYLNVVLGSIIIGLCFNIFFLPYNLISTTVFGLSEFFYNVIPINPGITILAVNIILLFFGILVLGYKDCKKYIIKPDKSFLRIDLSGFYVPQSIRSGR